MCPVDAFIAADERQVRVRLTDQGRALHDTAAEHPPEWVERCFGGDREAVRALKEEGYRVVLVNSNPATIMTDPELADRTYIEPVTPEWVAKVIERERPDALLPTMGGQTALNVAMALQRDGTLERFGVELEAVSGETDEQKEAIIANAEVIFAAAAAGVQVISAKHKSLAKNLLVVADVNAVPPPGVEGMELFMNGGQLPGCQALGVGPLAIGDIKYKTESGLFKQMIASDKPLALDFRHAFALARQLTA